MLPGQQEGCSGTRNLEDNISDLKAQVAANNKVIFFDSLFFFRLSIFQFIPFTKVLSKDTRIQIETQSQGRINR